MADALKAFNTEPYDANTNPKGFRILSPGGFGGVVDAAPVGVYAGTAFGDPSATGWTSPLTQGINGSVPAVLYRQGSAQATGAPTAISLPSDSNRVASATPDDIDPVTDITIRIFRVDDKNDTNKGYLPDVRYMRYTNAANNAPNTNGQTLMSDSAQFIDTQYFVFRMKNKKTNEIVKYIPSTVQAIGQSPAPVGRAPDYIDLKFNLFPVNVTGGPVASGGPVAATGTAWYGEDGQLDRDSDYKYEMFLETVLPARYYTAALEQA